jgi:hypothetical protein
MPVHPEADRQKLIGGPHAAPPSPEAPLSSAEEFERRLGPWEVDPTGSDPALVAALTVAGSLRQATPGYMVSPDPDLVDQLRHELVTGRVGTGAVGARAAVDSPQHLPVGSAFSVLFKRPWVATAVATVGIVVVLALQAFGKPAPPGTCDGRPCPATTTAAVAAAGGNSVGTPLSTVLQPTTTTTLAAQAPAPTAAPTSAATAPPATRPATTAPPTTAPRPTTTRAPTTTAPPTTAATTTTTAATATT